MHLLTCIGSSAKIRFFILMSENYWVRCELLHVTALNFSLNLTFMGPICFIYTNVAGSSSSGFDSYTCKKLVKTYWNLATLSSWLSILNFLCPKLASLKINVRFSITSAGAGLDHWKNVLVSSPVMFILH